jgi:hypothetical protein
MFRRALAYIRANIIAFLALFVALGGTGAYAATTANTIFSTDIVDGQVKNVDIANDAVGGLKIKPLAVGNTDLASNSVGGGKVIDNTLLSTDIKDGQVLSADLGNFAVTNSKLGSFSVTGDKISSRSVGASQIALPEGWHYIGDPGEPAFQNGWSNYDVGSHDGAVWQHAAYAIDTNNVVHLRGLVKDGTVGATIFTLPSNYCPWYYHLAPTLAADALARLTMTYITPDCSLSVSGAASNSYVALDPMSYTVYYYEHRVAGASAKGSAGRSLGGRTLPTGGERP